MHFKGTWLRVAGTYLVPVSFFIALVILWEVLLPFARIPRWLLPIPSDIYVSFIETAFLLPNHVLTTLLEIVAGFGIGSAIGMGLGIAIWYSKLMSKILYPLAVSIKTIPIIAIAPLITIWFGFGLTSKIVIAAIISFFPLVVNTATGLRSVDSELIDLLRSLSAKELQIFSKVRAIWCVPYIFSGLKVAITLSVVGAVVGEFVGAQSGLGYLLTNAVAYIDTPTIFVVLVLLSALGISLFGVIILIERVVAPWSVGKK
jgi:NitT/TauT family transport system permease protein